MRGCRCEPCSDGVPKLLCFSQGSSSDSMCSSHNAASSAPACFGLGSASSTSHCPSRRLYVCMQLRSNTPVPEQTWCLMHDDYSKIESHGIMKGIGPCRPELGRAHLWKRPEPRPLPRPVPPETCSDCPYDVLTRGNPGSTRLSQVVQVQAGAAAIPNVSCDYEGTVRRHNDSAAAQLYAAENKHWRTTPAMCVRLKRRFDSRSQMQSLLCPE